MQAKQEWLTRLIRPALLQSRLSQGICSIIGIGMCVIGLSGLLAKFASSPDYPALTDFGLYLNAANALPGNPYALEVNPGFDRYGYPPLLADILAGIQLIVGPDLILWLWPMACLAGLLGALVLLSRHFGVRMPWSAVLVVVGVVLIGRVVRSDIVQGQVNVFVLLLLAGGILLRTQGKIVMASLLFAIMMSLKPFMGAVAIYFLVRGDWRMARWMLGMGALVFFASFVPMGSNAIEGWNGWRQATEYFTSPAFASKPDNQSFYGLALRLFTHTEYGTPWINSQFLVSLLVGGAIGVAAMLAFLGLRNPNPDKPSPLPTDPAVMLLECAMVIALVTACGPLTEGNHLANAFAGLAAALIVGLRRLREGTQHTWLWVSVIATWSVMVFFIVYPRILPISYGVYSQWYGLEGVEILLTGRYGFLLMLAGGLTAVTIWQEQRALAALPPSRAAAAATRA